MSSYHIYGRKEINGKLYYLIGVSPDTTKSEYWPMEHVLTQSIASRCYLDDLVYSDVKDSHGYTTDATMSVFDPEWNKHFTVNKCGLKFRLHPNKEQEQRLRSWCGASRLIYNRLVSDYLADEETGNYRNHCSYTDVIDNRAFWSDIPKTILTQAARDFVKARKNYFDNDFGKPQFKSRKDRISFSICNNGTGSNNYLSKFNNFKINIDPENRTAGSITLPKGLGPIKATKHKRKFPKYIQNLCKSATIMMEPNGKWYCSLQVYNCVECLKPSAKSIGIDLGIKNYATEYKYDSLNSESPESSNVIPNPSYFDKDLEKLKILQQRFSKTKKNSKRHEKLRKEIAKCHVKIANKRNDFQHKLTKKIIDENQVIIIEDLNIRKMLRDFKNKHKHTLHRHISDAAWYAFRFKLDYKARWYGRQLIIVDPKNTSQICSCCKEPFDHHIELWEREVTCYHLGCKMFGIPVDRDLNAAKNIYARGIAFLRASSSS